MPSKAPYCSLAGIWFAHVIIGHGHYQKGQRTPVLKKTNWALFGISDHNIAPMGSGHFEGFSKIARIAKPWHNWGFRGLRSQYSTLWNRYL
jgi:hypothetical protein